MMKEKLLNYITNELMFDEPEFELGLDDNLFEEGILDSLGIMKLVVFIEAEFDKTIPPEDMVIENFMTIEAMSQYLSQS